jgi:hypothetical protein
MPCYVARQASGEVLGAGTLQPHAAAAGAWCFSALGYRSACNAGRFVLLAQPEEAKLHQLHMLKPSFAVVSCICTIPLQSRGKAPSTTHPSLHTNSFSLT